MDNTAALGTEVGIFSETHRKVRRKKKLILFMFVPIALGGVIGTRLLLTMPQAVVKYAMITAVLYLLFHLCS